LQSIYVFVWFFFDKSKTPAFATNIKALRMLGQSPFSVANRAKGHIVFFGIKSIAHGKLHLFLFLFLPVIFYHRGGYRLVTDSAFLQKIRGKGEKGTRGHDGRSKIAKKIIGMIGF